MLGLVAIVGGYAALVWTAGPIGLVVIALHIAAMLLAMRGRK